ncbi:CHAT domain-containing protein [Actinomadura sp. DC4]|uniref:CHAT domain-containing protein n=1 Tax=Actinomadura sp. DC4 TaxID=3055069 RepID=UPI0025AF1795|nr:CHAT domain-containing protein [Actinomadura sp. DC4]MDN3353842.1 CHAT domain-containing protein [Actinomadura sp. DC4]
MGPLPAGLVMVFFFALASLAFLQIVRSVDHPSRRRLSSTALLFSVFQSAGLTLGALCLVSPPVASAAGSAALAVAVLVNLRMVRREFARRSHRPMVPRNRREAAAMEWECRMALRQGAPGRVRPGWTRLNLARALVVLAREADGSGRAVEARDLLDGLRRDTSVDPDMLFDAYRELVDTIEFTGTEALYEETLDRLEEAARPLAADMPALYHVAIARGDHAAHQVSRSGSETTKRSFRLQARGYYEQALRLVRPGSDLALDAETRLALMPGPPGEFWLDERVGVWRSRLPGRRADRASVRFVLAYLLLARFARDDSERDREEAVRLLERLARGRSELRTHAAELLPTARASIAWRPRAGTAEEIGAAFRRAFDERARESVGGLQRVTADWIAWAIEEEDVEEAAEACWRRAMTLPPLVLRPHSWRLRAETAARLGGNAAEAGFWLLAASRVREAAVAMEYGRTVAFGLATAAPPPELARRLTEAGRRDLYTDYARAVEAAIRREFGIAGQDEASERPWGEIDRLRRAIAEVLGDAEIQPPLAYEEIRAVAVGGPIVYLGATERGGFAIIVRSDGEPQVLPLPRLTAPEVAERAKTLARVVEGAPDSAWETADGPGQGLYPWMWSAVMEPLTVQLAGREAALIATGPLGAFPLHAAAPTRNAPPASDYLLLRRAPSARLLRDARTAAMTVSARPLTLLAADVPHPADGPDLRLVAYQTRALHERYGARCERLPDATRAQALATIGPAGAWHFACAVRREPDLLDSHFAMADGRLTLRDLILRDGSHRLAVLSSHETTAPGGSIGLPDGLMYAGVAAVIASAWRVEETATACLLLRFHELWQGGRAPRRAFAEAQCWLRKATNEELTRYDPNLVAEPRLEAESLALWRARRPFREPKYWAAFSYTGV